MKPFRLGPAVLCELISFSIFTMHSFAPTIPVLQQSLLFGWQLPLKGGESKHRGPALS